MKTQPSPSKSVRFDVFRRDGFQCRYCGSKPPDVVLELDHVSPRAEGGGNDPLNLVTSCAACNRGKSAKVLTGPWSGGPDADMEYLMAAQELAEMRRYQKTLKAQEKAAEELVDSLLQVWRRISTEDWEPKRQVIRQALRRNCAEDVRSAVEDIAHRVSSGFFQGRNDWYRYFHGMLKHKREERDVR